MTHVEDELTSQPECWRRAAAQAAAHTAALPAPGERVAVVGCGTSYFMAQAVAALREGAGRGETDAFAASEFPHGRAYDRVVALTRSGTTTEVLDLLGRLRDGVRTTAVTADPATPVMSLAHDTVVLDYAEERSVVQTRFATTACTPGPSRTTPAPPSRRRCPKGSWSASSSPSSAAAGASDWPTRPG
jgi:fructoselysine-6-P-deglycase FrlB-like protein